MPPFPRPSLINCIGPMKTSSQRFRIRQKLRLLYQVCRDKTIKRAQFYARFSSANFSLIYHIDGIVEHQRVRLPQQPGQKQPAIQRSFSIGLPYRIYAASHSKRQNQYARRGIFLGKKKHNSTTRLKIRLVSKDR